MCLGDVTGLHRQPRPPQLGDLYRSSSVPLAGPAAKFDMPVITRRAVPRSSLALNDVPQGVGGQQAHRAAPSHRGALASYRGAGVQRSKARSRAISREHAESSNQTATPSRATRLSKHVEEHSSPPTVLATAMSYNERATRERHMLWCEALHRDAARRAALEAAWAKGTLSPPSTEIPASHRSAATSGEADAARQVALQTMKPVDKAFVGTYTTMFNWLDGYGTRPVTPPTAPHRQSPSPPRNRNPSFQQLLKPLVNSPSNRIFTCKHSLKLRKGYELDSPAANPEYLPAGAMVLVVERRSLPDGVERAAVKRVGCYEGSCGWITISRDDELSLQARAVRVARKAGRRAAILDAAAQAEAAAAAEAAVDAAAAAAAAEEEAAAGEPAAAQPDGTPAYSSKSAAEPKKEPAEKRAKGSRKKKDSDGGHGLSLTPSTELEALVTELKAKALAEDAKLHPSKKRNTVKLGEMLLTRQIKIPELVSSWAKRGVEPITRMQFRQNMRKLFEMACRDDASSGAIPNVKEIDALFDHFDDDHGGTLDVGELRNVLKGLKTAAVDSIKEAEPIREAVELLRQRAKETQQVCDATRASEKADARFDELRGVKSVGARLGALLQMRAIKVNDLTTRWDPNGDGVDKKEFRENVLALGLEAQPSELDSLFESLDEDGGGTLDGDELKHALKTLADAFQQAELDVVRLKKETVELAKAAKSAQVELRKQQKADEFEAAEKQAVIAAARQAKDSELKAARLARQAEILARKEAIKAEQRAFEERVAAQRALGAIAASTGSTKGAAAPEEAAGIGLLGARYSIS